MSPLPPLAVAVPLATAALIAILSKHAPRWLRTALSLAAALFAVAVCALLVNATIRHGAVVHWFGGWTPRHGVSLGIAFVVEPASAALAALTALLTTASLFFAWTYYDQDDGAFPALMLVFCGALIGFFLTGDLFNLFVFFELMSVSAYALTGFRSEDQGAVQGALAFGVVNSTGAFLVLAGVTMTYARTGALTFAQIAHTLSGPSDPLIVVAFALIVCGFIVKAAIVPFHFWLSDAHAVAPTPLCVLFSGIMVQGGLYAVARCYWSVFSGTLAPHAGEVRGVLIGLGLLTAIVGAVMAYSQRHIKRLLAFSTVAHSGLMLCAVAMLDPLSLGGFFIYVLGHGLVKGALFLGSGIVLNRYATLDVEAMRGKLAEVPWLAGVFVVGALGLAGVPPFGTFAGKAMMDQAAERAHLGWTSVVLSLAAAVTGAAVLNAAGRMTFGWGPPPDPQAVTPGEEQRETKPARGIALGVMAAPTLVLIALSVAIGAEPPLVNEAFASAQRFTDRLLQEHVVLGMATGSALPSATFTGGGSDIAVGIAAGLLAVALAAIGLFAHHAGALWRRMARVYDAGMRIPHLWHTGIVTDYVAWLVVGTAAIGATLLAVVR